MIEDNDAYYIVSKIMQGIIDERNHILHHEPEQPETDEEEVKYEAKIDECISNLNNILVKNERTRDARHDETYEDDKTKEKIVKCRDGKRNIVLADTVTEIGDQAFNRCKNLIEIDLKNVQKIGSYAFEECEKLRSLKIPKSCTYIGEYAFKDCGSLEKIEFEEGIQSLYIDEGAFMDCDSLLEINIPDCITEIAPRTFYGCTRVERIDLPENLSVIGESAFEECRQLDFKHNAAGQTILPDSLRIISDLAFTNCDKLVRIKLPENVGKLGKGIFKDCSELEEVYIGKSTTFIGDSPFRGCRLLRKIEVNPSNRYFRTDQQNHALYNKNRSKLICFPASNCKDGVIEIPAEKVTPKNGYRMDCRKSEIGSEGVDVIRIENTVSGQVYIRDDVIQKEVDGSLRTIYCCHEKITEYEIKDSVTEVASWAFAYCSDLKRIIASDSVDIIGENAFYKCTSLRSIQLPDGVTYIDDMAFKNCDNLLELSIPASVEQFGWYILAGCNQLRNIYVIENSDAVDWYQKYKQNSRKTPPHLEILSEEVYDRFIQKLSEECDSDVENIEKHPQILSQIKAQLSSVDGL